MHISDRTVFLFVTCFLALPLSALPSPVAADDEPILLTLDRDRLTWTEPVGEASYDIVRGDLTSLLGGGGAYIPSTQECLADDLVAGELFYPDEPAVAGQGYWFLVRGERSTRGYETFEGGQVDGRDGEINVSNGACPTYRCAADIPPSYDQTNKIAGGACVEAKGITGPPACPEADYLRSDRDVGLIKDTYLFTRSVEAPVVPSSGDGQVFNPQLDKFICSGFETVPASQFLFDDLNACYRGASRCLSNCLIVFVDFDWMVDTPDLLEIYAEVAEAHGGVCNFDTWSGLPPGPTPGFHATDLGEGNWRWLVRAREQCTINGCACDGWVQVVLSDTGVMTEEALVNNSTPRCAGSRWSY
jgi:hypothetical protein